MTYLIKFTKEKLCDLLDGKIISERQYIECEKCGESTKVWLQFEQQN